MFRTVKATQSDILANLVADMIEANPASIVYDHWYDHYRWEYEGVDLRVIPNREWNVGIVGYSIQTFSYQRQPLTPSLKNRSRLMSVFEQSIEKYNHAMKEKEFFKSELSALDAINKLNTTKGESPSLTGNAP